MNSGLELLNSFEDTQAPGAPHGGAALMRRTSVLGRWPKTLAQGEFILPEHFNQKDGAALWAAKSKKKDMPKRVLLFGTGGQFRGRLSGLQLKPKRSPVQRVRFGKEEQQNERALTFVKKSEQAICRLLRRGTSQHYRCHPFNQGFALWLISVFWHILFSIGNS
jgi:hypothetical protein